MSSLQGVGAIVRTEAEHPIQYHKPTTDSQGEPAMSTNAKRADTKATKTDSKLPSVPQFRPLVLPDDIPVDSFFGSVLAQRRSGKTTLVQYMLEQLQKHRDYKFSHIFLISPTNAGFYPSIPKRFRFRKMEKLQWIVDQQCSVRDFNKKQKQRSKMVRSRICIVIDDCATGNDMKYNRQLDTLALNGRHYGYTGDRSKRNDRGMGDPLPGNGISVVLLAQSLTSISRKSRLNLDFCCANNLTSYVEADKMCEEMGFYSQYGEGEAEGTMKKYGRNVWRNLVAGDNCKPFQFVVILNHLQNKKHLCDYVRTIVADVEPRPKRLFGTRSDEDCSTDEDDETNL